MHRKAWLHQAGAGLLEIMLVLSIITVLLLMSYRSYQSYRFGADAQLIRENVQNIQAAGNAYYIANCSNLSSLDVGIWQDLSVLADYLSGESDYYNPWGSEYTPGSRNWYQVRYQQTASGNYILCVQINLSPEYDPSHYYLLLGATAYSGGGAGTAGLCSPSPHSVVWQSLPSIALPGYMNSQVVSRLREFRQNNTLNWSKGCAS